MGIYSLTGPGKKEVLVGRREDGEVRTCSGASEIHLALWHHTKCKPCASAKPLQIRRTCIAAKYQQNTAEFDSAGIRPIRTSNMPMCADSRAAKNHAERDRW